MSSAATCPARLTFRLGWGFIMGPPDVYPIQKAVSGLGIVGFGPPNQSTPHGPDEWIRRLGTLPLMHQPGEKRYRGQPVEPPARVPGRRRGARLDDRRTIWRSVRCC